MAAHSSGRQHCLNLHYRGKRRSGSMVASLHTKPASPEAPTSVARAHACGAATECNHRKRARAVRSTDPLDGFVKHVVGLLSCHGTCVMPTSHLMPDMILKGRRGSLHGPRHGRVSRSGRTAGDGLPATPRSDSIAEDPDVCAPLLASGSLSYPCALLPSCMLSSRAHSLKTARSC